MTTTDLTPRERHRLLAELANFLDDLPHDRFHMPKWASPDATAHSCGTAACACGWGATIHQKQGWTFIDLPTGDGESCRCPFFEGQSGYVGFACFYGLSLDLAQAITMPYSNVMPSYFDDYGAAFVHVTPRHAADRIRKVLAIVDPEVLTESVGTPVLEGAAS